MAQEPTDVDRELDALLKDLGMKDPTIEDLEQLAGKLVRDADMFGGGPATARDLAAGLRRRALRMRNQGR